MTHHSVSPQKSSASHSHQPHNTSELAPIHMSTPYWHPQPPKLDVAKLREMSIPIDGSFVTGIEEISEKMGKKLLLNPITNFPLGRNVPDATLRPALQWNDPKIALPGYYPGATFVDPFTKIFSSKHSIPVGSKFASIGQTIHLARLDGNEALGIRLPDSSNTIIRGPGTFTFYAPITPLGRAINIVGPESQNAPQYFGARGQQNATDVFTCNVETGRVFVFQIGDEIKILPPGQYAIQQSDATFLKNLMTREHEMIISVEAKLANNVVIQLNFNVRGSIPDPKTFATEAATFDNLNRAIDDKLSGLILQEVADLQITEDPTGHPNINESASDNTKASAALQTKINERMRTSVKNQLGDYLQSIGAELSDIRLVSFGFNGQVQKALDHAAGETINTNARLKNATKNAESAIIEARALADASRQAASAQADAKRLLAEADAYQVTTTARAEADAVKIKAQAEHDAIHLLAEADNTIDSEQAQRMQTQRERTRQFKAVANGSGKATFIMENPENMMPAAIGKLLTKS